MGNWNEIHSDFTEELQKEWEKREFDYKDAEQWIGIGLTPKEFKLAYWLREEKSKITEVEDFDNPQWIKDAGLNLKQLKKEFFNRV